MADKKLFTTPPGIVGYNTLVSDGREGYTLNLFLNADNAEVQTFAKEAFGAHEEILKTLSNTKGRTTFTLREIKGADAHVSMAKHLDADANYYLLKTSTKFQPVIFDEKGERTALNGYVGQGSKLRARIGLRGYVAPAMHGTKIDLNGVQIIELADTKPKEKVFDAVEANIDLD